MSLKKVFPTHRLLGQLQGFYRKLVTLITFELQLYGIMCFNKTTWKRKNAETQTATNDHFHCR